MRENSPELRVLIWSGYGAEQSVAGLLPRGAVGVISKPYRITELSQMIASSKRP